VRAEFIVVLGAALWNGEPCPELGRRLAWAARLYADGHATRVLCSGGFSRGRSEAKAMKKRLEQLGVPDAAIEIDESGTSTRRSVRAVTKRVSAGERVIFVSSAYHLPRVRAEARRRGVNTSVSAAPARASLRQELREAVARVAYAVPV
jgi:vancomycin permeability regulator SanA